MRIQQTQDTMNKVNAIRETLQDFTNSIEEAECICLVMYCTFVMDHCHSSGSDYKDRARKLLEDFLEQANMVAVIGGGEGDEIES